jgi:serine/threonine protein kinase
MENNGHYGAQGGQTSFCLGHPPHALRAGEIICRICGTLAAGALIGIYQVRNLLGTGRSGQAYLAVHQRTGQPVVIKLFPEDVSTNHLWDAARREVRTVTALRHPAILPVFSCTTWSADASFGDSQAGLDYRFAQSKDSTYLLTLCQYIPGTLNNFIAYYQKREAQLALYEEGIGLLALLINLIQQAGSALSTAHARGIMHGALVPGNILLANHDRLWLADFGLARLHPPPQAYLPPELYSANNTSTHMGNMQAYWHAITPASDQYMFALTCQQLFSHILQQNEYEYLHPVLQRATQQRPERRYPSVDLFVQDLVALSKQISAYTAASGQSPEYSNHRKTDKLSPTTPTPSANFAGSLTPPLPMVPLSYPTTPMLPTPPNTPALPATPLTPSAPSPSEDWEKRGDKQFTMHNYEDALVAYHRAVEMNPGKASLWLALGDSYFALERFKEALMAYEQAMYLNPNDPQAWSNRGTTLDALGRHREAMDCYERAEQLELA